MVKPNKFQGAVEHTLSSGWKVWIAEYLTQGQRDSLTSIWMAAASLNGFPTEEELKSGNADKEKVHILRGLLMEQNNALKVATVVKMAAPDGTLFEGSDLTLDIILSVPEGEKDEILALAEDVANPKKKPTMPTSINS